MPGKLPALASNAALLLTVTTLMWGGNAVAGKLAVGDVSPLLLTWFRWTLASAVLVVIARDQLRKDWPVIVRHLPYLFVMGAIGFAVFNALLYSSLLYTTAINVTIIQAGMPMFIFILNFIVFRMRIHWSQAAGYSFTLAGVLLVALGGDFGSLAGLKVNFGDAIMLVAAFVYGAYSVALRAKPDIHWLSFLTTIIVGAAITSIPFAAYEATTDGFIWPVTSIGWAVVVYTAIGPSILAQGSYIRGIDLIGANKAALFLNLVPIFGAFLAVILLGEQFHWYHAVSLVLVIGGIVMAQRLSQRA